MLLLFFIILLVVITIVTYYLDSSHYWVSFTAVCLIIAILFFVLDTFKTNSQICDLKSQIDFSIASKSPEIEILNAKKELKMLVEQGKVYYLRVIPVEDKYLNFEEN